MKVLGLDPSLTSTGLALVEGGKVLELKRIRSKKKGHERVQEILSEVIYYAAQADMVGIEGVAYGAKGSSVAQIFGLWGVLTHALWGLGPRGGGDNYYVVPPTVRAKYGSGKGNAGKDEVLAAVIRRYLDVDVTGNDVADALVIAAMGARQYDAPLEANLPAANLKAMEGVTWPELQRAQSR